MAPALGLGARVLIAFMAATGISLAAQPAGPAGSDPVLSRLVEQERYSEAIDQAIARLRADAAVHGPLSRVTLASLERAGRTAAEAGELAMGEAILTAALDASRQAVGANDPGLSTAWITLGRIARLKGERDRAWRDYEEARRLVDRAGSSWEGVRADLEHAEGSWFRKEDMQRALALYGLSLARQRRVSPSMNFQEADTLTWMGWMLGRMGRPAEAGPYLRRARRELEQLGLGRHSLNGVIANALAERLALQGRWDEAEPHFREAAEIFAAAREKYPPGFARRVRPLDGYEALTVVALRRGRWNEAWETLQRSRAAVHVDFAGLGLWRDLDPDGFHQAQALRHDLSELKHSLGKESAEGRVTWNAATHASVLRWLETWARLRSLQARYLRSHPVRPSLERVRAMLGPSSALLGFLELNLGAERTDGGTGVRREGWLYVLRRSGPIVWAPLPSLQEPDDARLRQAWQRTSRAAFWPLHVDPDPEVTADHRVLARRYIDPALPHLAGIRHLIVEGAMIPYESMVLPDGRMLGESFDVTYVPSALVASMLAQRWTDATGQPPRAVLSISAEAPKPGSETLERLASVTAGERALRISRKSFSRSETPLDDLPPLPWAAAEATLVARKFPRSVLLQGPAGVERRLIDISHGDALARFDVIHFAGHSLSDGLPELAGLALSGRRDAEPPGIDGILDVEEILLGWDLDARLLTLSGCETARVAGAERGEMLGFTSALFAAGARSVLSSLWPVDDRATALLMDRFYDDLTGSYTDERAGLRGTPMTLAGALREAKMHLRGLTDEEGRHPFEHPVYWAGFILMGLPEPDPRPPEALR